LILSEHHIESAVSPDHGSDELDKPTIEDVEREVGSALAIAGGDADRALYLLGLAAGIARRHRAERDRLREALEGMKDFVSGGTHREVVAERDRLRAVVDAADKLLGEGRTSWSPEHERLADALAALDETPPIRRVLTDSARDVEAEQDRLRAVLANTTSDWEVRAIDAEAERNRLRAVAEAAREAVDAQRAWIARAQVGGVSSIDNESIRRAAAFATLGTRIGALDNGDEMPSPRERADPGDIIEICGIPYRVSTLKQITMEGTLSAVTLHLAVEAT
jgi:hypothetical protein